MKQLTCEMCGGTDLIKQDGVFVCQSCGTKYSVEEAKKMMVEGTVEVTGTVKVDNSAIVDNLYIAARREWSNGNYDRAGVHYGQLLLERPDDWEASLYDTLCQAATCKLVAIESSALLVKNCISTVFLLVKNEDNPQSVYQKIFDSIMLIANMLFEGSKTSYSTQAAQIDRIYPIATPKPASYYDASYQAMYQFSKQYAACIQILAECGSQFGLLYEDTLVETYLKYALTAWKHIYTIEDKAKKALQFSIYNDSIGNLYSSRLYSVSDDIKNQAAFIADKISKYDPNYVRPNPTKTKLEDSMEMKLIEAQVAEMNKKSETGGCYIATSVYGSYDCPEVWTLRRYRDNTLAKTWYGCAFIHTYYAISPTLVKWFGNTKWFKRICKNWLDKIVERFNNAGVENTPYEDRIW